ncbi:MAG TPA: hypothetical protein VG621_03130 [Candidatus Paceibacterota bacterium]|nr:hypothetical protein [Candidatus Paceibacterota bacterium]
MELPFLREPQFGQDYESNLWWITHPREREEIAAKNIDEAKQIAKKVFLEWREAKFDLLDELRLSNEKRISLKEEFPKKVTLIQEIKHKIES